MSTSMDVPVEDDSGSCSSHSQINPVSHDPQPMDVSVGSPSSAPTELCPAVKCRWKGCYKWFSNLNKLATHVSETHTVAGSEGLFYCSWEGCMRNQRGFNARYKMLVHVRTHTNEKPHKCFECHKSFSRAENLKIHARSHTGEKPYICPVPGCHKAYSNSSDRFKHTRTHLIDRPYMCKVPGCTKRYTDPSSLRKHAKTNSHLFTTQPLSYPKSKNKDKNALQIIESEEENQRLKVECVTHYSTSWLQSIYPNNNLSWNRPGEQEAPLDLTTHHSPYH